MKKQTKKFEVQFPISQVVKLQLLKKLLKREGIRSNIHKSSISVCAGITEVYTVEFLENCTRIDTNGKTIYHLTLYTVDVQKVCNWINSVVKGGKKFYNQNLTRSGQDPVK